MTSVYVTTSEPHVASKNVNSLECLIEEGHGAICLACFLGSPRFLEALVCFEFV